MYENFENVLQLVNISIDLIFKSCKIYSQSLFNILLIEVILEIIVDPLFNNIELLNLYNFVSRMCVYALKVDILLLFHRVLPNTSIDPQYAQEIL